MAIAVGSRLPETTFRVMTSSGPTAKTAAEVFDGKRVVAEITVSVVAEE